MSNTHKTIQNYEKVLDLFFHNGDIIISAQRPGSETLCLFKLHRKMLATQAKGLSMLLLPAAPPHETDANEYFEGTPVVRLFDDPADLARFFNAMYTPSTLVSRRYMATNAFDAFPMLVLADKYVADDIECMIEYQIRHDWPKNVYEWDAFESRAVHTYRMHQETESDFPWDALVPEPASYIRLARIAKVVEPRRVAAAFYELSRMNPKNIWELESVPGRCDDSTPAQLIKIRRAMWSLLTEDELRRLQRGKQAMADHMASLVQFLPERARLLDATCIQGWRKTAAKLVQSDDILTGLLQFCDGTTLVGHMCHTCLSMTRREVKWERELLFSTLPEYFDVQPNERAHISTYHTPDFEFVKV